MWRRIYFLLVLVRVYFALSPSYLHPDENFQGPEVIAGRVFDYPVHETWEFTAAHPIRSVFPLWLAYGWPMYILRWLWEGFGYDVSPAVVYRALRVLMLALSLVLEDWAVHELVESPRARRVAVSLVASSYVTWTFQTHTFSNSLETLLVCWSLVLVQRIAADKKRSSVVASAMLGCMLVVGLFNRITFPAFLLLPGLRLLPHFTRKPLSLAFLAAAALTTAFVAVCVDTASYTPGDFSFAALARPVVAPLNNLRYNADAANLALHGLHPRYQHLLANLPQLLGPAFPLLLSARLAPPLLSALSGTALLSIFPHQEPRFLLPAIPLILSSLRLPTRPALWRVWVVSWIVFNALLGALMGVYHQGGVVPVQTHLAACASPPGHAFWWKTYSPPTWLLNGRNAELQTVDLMGMEAGRMLEAVGAVVPGCDVASPAGRPETPASLKPIYLIAPRSALFLAPYTHPNTSLPLSLEEVFAHRAHVNLDDLDFGGEGVWGTLRRVVGGRGPFQLPTQHNHPTYAALNLPPASTSVIFLPPSSHPGTGTALVPSSSPSPTPASSLPTSPRLSLPAAWPYFFRLATSVSPSNHA
ncbi:GPI mannosyltransferase 4 [Boeremia exigua]|uniref:GPI mannosyltransferase 4 n=1 Tax=Boeremia exigua TaxID=749465 RepID=UPI001E8D2C48|nr:GPI mannosyltransferase 4 [Boeremia exigua]KAH6622402.1 GPI mannosyltransferase 4 [Boeremia exigua]